MQELKQELEKVGANLSAPDQDPTDFSGIRRLRLLYSKAHEGGTHSTRPSREAGIKRAHAVSKHQSVHPDSPTRVILVTSDGFISGMSESASIAVVVGSVVGLLLISYLIYKYFTWKPKLIARRGYRAVAKSKGISGVDEVVEATSNSDVLRASASGPSPDIPAPPQTTKV